MKAGLGTGPGTEPGKTRFNPPPVEALASLFPQLELVGFIGQGGMGAVYKARQRTLDRFVALKILPPGAAGDPGFAERFNREARALARLNHPNIVAVHDFGQVSMAAGAPTAGVQPPQPPATLHYLVMEFVDGPNLRQVEVAGRLAPEQALGIVPQICDALQFAHNEGIVHRDIKPENILLDKKGRVKITDFGIAKIVGSPAGQQPLTGARDVVGTPHYMAPEQVEKPQTVDHRADIYSLGVVFYEMLTGELPLGRFAPPSRKVQVDVRLDEVVLHTLEKEPALRYQQASQVKTAVETIAGSATPAAFGGDPAQGGRVNPEAFIEEALARDYTLDIGRCLSRGWTLVRSDFWPLVGITALVLVLLSAVSSSEKTSVLGMLLGGPLFGGLWFHFLKKLRGELVSVETAFAGFSSRFLHLVLAGFVTDLLTMLGLLCLLVPGIYLLVAWNFTLPLVIDQRLDFWAAMRLSRKMITKHWWKFFWFLALLVAIDLAGAACFCVGFFVAFPVTFAALVCAYEDTFNPGRQPAACAAETAQLPQPLQARSAWSHGFLAGFVVIFLLLCAASAFVNFTTLEGVLVALAAASTLAAAILFLLKESSMPRGVLTVFLTVFLAVFGLGTAVTLLLPNRFVSTARLNLTPLVEAESGRAPGVATSYDPFLIQAELECIPSGMILRRVISDLDLSHKWSMRFGRGEALTTNQALTILESMVHVRPVRNSSLVEIVVWNADRDEAALIANQIARAAQEHYQEAQAAAAGPGLRCELVDSALPQLRPTGPNRPFGLALATLTGLLCATVAGAAWAALRGRPRPRLPRGFLPVFAAMFLLVCGVGTAFTFALPEAFASTARIKLPYPGGVGSVGPAASAHYDPDRLQTAFEVLRSEVILERVIADLDLNQTWGTRYGNGAPLKTAESMMLLRQRLDLRPVRNTYLLEIRCFDQEPAEAARLANELAEVFQRHWQETDVGAGAGAGRVEIVEQAVPALRPVRPNKPLNLLLALAGGLLAGLVSGLAFSTWAATRTARKSGSACTPGRQSPPAPGTS